MNHGRRVARRAVRERAPAAADPPLLLDTHVWIWLMEGVTTELSAAAITKLRAGSRAGRLMVSAISVWEVAMLDAKRRITLSMDCSTWVERALAAPGIELVALSPAIAIQSTRLPGNLSGDPADGMLVATARANGARLVTRDRTLIDYAAGGHLAVLDATP
jgi:PIN domain nuclease of toxin-antitoxin system